MEGKRTQGGLPHIPNYNLGPLFKHWAEAGNDTTICYGDSVRLGAPPADSARYFWSPLFTTDPQPWVAPDQTTTYYLTLTDSTVAADVTCRSNTDSVTVRVVQPPVADFLVNGLTTYVDTPRTFTNISAGANQYRWFMGDGTVSYDSILTHSYSKPGTYEVKLVATNAGGNCKLRDTARKEVVVQPAPSDTDTTVQPPGYGWRVYPNPAGETVTVEYTLDADSSGRFMLYNVVGQQVSRYVLLPGRHHRRISLRHLSGGLYLYRLEQGDELKETGKLVIID